MRSQLSIARVCRHESTLRFAYRKAASSRARFTLDSVGEARKLLKDLLLCRQISG